MGSAAAAPFRPIHLAVRTLERLGRGRSRREVTDAERQSDWRGPRAADRCQLLTDALAVAGGVPAVVGPDQQDREPMRARVQARP